APLVGTYGLGAPLVSSYAVAPVAVAAPVVAATTYRTQKTYAAPVATVVSTKAYTAPAVAVAAPVVKSYGLGLGAPLVGAYGAPALLGGYGLGAKGIY